MPPAGPNPSFFSFGNKLVYSAGGLKAGELRNHNRDTFLNRLFEGFPRRLIIIYQDDPRELLESCNGNDILVYLARDPDISLFAVRNDVG
jgi:hypothetical protein